MPAKIDTPGKASKFGPVSADLAAKIIQDRTEGLTYTELAKKYSVSKWWCIQHLRSIKPNLSWLEAKWRSAENDGEQLLHTLGYSHIINLNRLCPSPYWDYYAEKDGQRWLFDVTINGAKDLIDKGLRAIEGFNHAVLLKADTGWQFIEIRTRQIEINTKGGRE